MMSFDGIAKRKAALKDAESKGIVADSKEVRLTLMQQFHDGKKTLEEVQADKKTLEEVQAELSAIKKNAKRNGKLTRNQAYIGRTIPEATQ